MIALGKTWPDRCHGTGSESAVSEVRKSVYLGTEDADICPEQSWRLDDARLRGGAPGIRELGHRLNLL